MKKFRNEFENMNYQTTFSAKQRCSYFILKQRDFKQVEDVWLTFSKVYLNLLCKFDPTNKAW